MAKRDNHYEAAFEAYLRSHKLAYVAVDEAKRSQQTDGTLKSLDFIVTPRGNQASWLVDIKGRRFPTGRQKQYWKNWSTRDELRSLARWEELLGTQFTGLLVFAFHVVGPFSPLPAEQLFAFRGQQYAFVGIQLHHYSSYSHVISPQWDTVAMPVAKFRELALPVERLFGLPANPVGCVQSVRG
ncbi:MAG TPA: HYExAFE family protein [Pirellulaceae bacterium]|nr:HYExAFE family protein [Pirellulaceae bacterium]